MIEKEKISISINAKLLKRLRRESRKKKLNLSKYIEDTIYFSLAYQRDIIPQISEMKRLFKKLKMKEKKKK